jgi:predicted SprT family Zn-dependent metalloprotease
LNYNEELIDLIKIKIGSEYFTKDELDLEKMIKMFFDKVLKVVENEILHLITTYKRMKMHFM